MEVLKNEHIGIVWNSLLVILVTKRGIMSWSFTCGSSLLFLDISNNIFINIFVNYFNSNLVYSFDTKEYIIYKYEQLNEFDWVAAAYFIKSF